jgi:hypothetical protein
MKTVEDCIEVLVGMQEQNGEFNIERSDVSLITSLARQTVRGTPYTDRQHSLAKQKVSYYRSQYESNGYNIDIAINELRLPLRQIDRTRWIKIVEAPDFLLERDQHEGPWIGIRFIFQKKLINSIDSVKRNLGDGNYDKQNKVHYFPLDEIAVYEILSAFNEQNNFEVDDQLTEYYGKIVDMKNNKEQYVPGIYKLQLKNLNNKGVEYAISTIGTPDINNLCHYYDQKERYGLEHFDDNDLDQSVKLLTPLTKKIVSRKQSNVLVNKKQYTTENLVESILELYRFPLLILINGEQTCADELLKFHRAFSGIIPNESCSVLFRLDNDTIDGKNFNTYIKQHNLNNPVDNNTKVVYINNKLPKPLLKSSWEPIAAITNYSGKQYGSGHTDAYLSDLDLVIHYDDDVSPWKRNIIEKI